MALATLAGYVAYPANRLPRLPLFRISASVARLFVCLMFVCFYGLATLAEFTQKVPRNWIKFWALSGLFTQQKVPRILKKCKQTRQGPEFERLPGHFLG